MNAINEVRSECCPRSQLTLKRTSDWGQVALLYLSVLPLYFYVIAPTHGDIELYRRIATSLVDGILPYKDETFEYPPYSILFFLLPTLGGDLWQFQLLFAIQVLVFDVIAKAYFLNSNVAPAERSLSFWGFTLATWSFAYFYFQRLDLIPAVLCFLSLIFLSQGRAFASGALLSLSIGVKVFPVLVAPMLAIAALRAGNLRRFLLGATLGMAPLLLSTFVWPWWNFAKFHTGRGLQVESIYASFIWGLHQFAGLPADWEWVTSWQEVHGVMADQLLLPGKVAFVAASVFGVFASAIVTMRARRFHVPTMAHYALIAILPFVAFNYVLSPQYMIWLLPFAALGLQQSPKLPSVLILFCCTLTPVFYPSPNYSTGLSKVETLVLFLRNILLVAAWCHFLWQYLKTATGRRIGFTRFEEIQCR